MRSCQLYAFVMQVVVSQPSRPGEIHLFLVSANQAGILAYLSGNWHPVNERHRLAAVTSIHVNVLTAYQSKRTKPSIIVRLSMTPESMGNHDLGDHGCRLPRSRRRWSSGRRRCGI